MWSLILQFCFLIFLINNIYCEQAENRKSGFSEKFNYDHLVLAQSWPPTSCMHENNVWSEAKEHHTSCDFHNSGRNSWSIHGLWPTNRDRSVKVERCTYSVKYKSHMISPYVKDALNKKWFTSNLAISDDKFLKHEFIKHGTCTYDLNIGKTANDYFVKALDLFDSNNAGEILEKANIVPGGKYKLQQLIDALEKELKVHVRIFCKGFQETGEQYLHEIRVCFDRSFERIDCNKHETTSTCKPKIPINYIPKYKQKSFRVQSKLEPELQ